MTPASSSLPTPNASFGLHPSRIQDSTFDLSGNRCARRAIAFELYTFLGNDCLYERIHLVNTLGVFTWRIHLVRVPCARPLSRAPALGARARSRAVGACSCSRRGLFTWRIHLASFGARARSVGSIHARARITHRSQQIYIS